MKPVVTTFVAALVLIGGAGCDRGEGTIVEHGSNGADLVTAVTEAKPAQAPFENLTEIGISLDDECVLVVVADDEPERIQGLRAVDDLGPYAGMLFVFPSEITVQFTMQDTITDITIGFFDANGEQVSTEHMVPCETTSNCPLYSADGPFRFSLEVLGDAPLADTLVPCTPPA